MKPAPAAEPLFPRRRDVDRGPIDSVERSPDTLAEMPPWRQIVTHPGAIWLPAVILFTAGQIFLLTGFLILGLDPEDEESLGWTTFIANAAGYALLLLVLERRRPRELTRHPGWFLAAGLLLGAVLLAASVGIIHLLGGVEWGPMNSGVAWASLLLTLGIGPAIGEELMFRGVAFRYLEQGLGTWLALAISACAFGALHLGNPNATGWSAAAIALEAGVMLAALYALTRSLWIVIGVHLTWNVTQGVLFGYNVSGIEGFTGWLSPTPVGDPLISGGEFGVEGSVVAIAVCGLAALVAIALLIRSEGVIRPAWVRGRQMAHARDASARQVRHELD